MGIARDSVMCMCLTYVPVALFVSVIMLVRKLLVLSNCFMNTAKGKGHSFAFSFWVAWLVGTDSCNPSHSMGSEQIVSGVWFDLLSQNTKFNSHIPTSAVFGSNCARCRLSLTHPPTHPLKYYLQYSANKSHYPPTSCVWFSHRFVNLQSA